MSTDTTGSHGSMVTNGSYNQTGLDGLHSQMVTTVQNVAYCVHMLDEHMQQKCNVKQCTKYAHNGHT